MLQPKTLFVSVVLVTISSVLFHQYYNEISNLWPFEGLMTLLLKIQNIRIREILTIGTRPIESRSQPLDGDTQTEKFQRKKEKLFTPDQLQKYDGQPGSKGLYLGILGLVYNVKKGKKHYGPGGGYEFFAGRDASRAFVSGDFTVKGLIDDIEGLTGADYIGLDEWVRFYEKDYKYIGKLIGRYYDENGEPTPYNIEVKKWIAKAYQEKEEQNQEKKIFPPCNSEWTAEAGARVWCTAHSGGVDRDWIGVPRKLYTPGHHGGPRCACIKNIGPPSYDPQKKMHHDRGDLDYPNLEEYFGCHPEATTCIINNK